MFHSRLQQSPQVVCKSLTRRKLGRTSALLLVGVSFLCLPSVQAYADSVDASFSVTNGSQTEMFVLATYKTGYAWGGSAFNNQTDSRTHSIKTGETKKFKARFRRGDRWTSVLVFKNRKSRDDYAFKEFAKDISKLVVSSLESPLGAIIRQAVEDGLTKESATISALAMNGTPMAKGLIAGKKGGGADLYFDKYRVLCTKASIDKDNCCLSHKLRPKRKIVLTQLVCRDKTEGGKDEIFLQIFYGDKLYERVPSRGHKSLKDNGPESVWTINHEIYFDTDQTVKIVVIEDDKASKDDYIGTITVTGDTPLSKMFRKQVPYYRTVNGKQVQAGVDLVPYFVGAVHKLTGSDTDYRFTWHLEPNY